jgi:putative transposase
MLIKRAYKFKLKPHQAHTTKCLQFAGARRYIFNHGLAERQKAYEITGTSLSYFDQNKELTFLKEQSETI